MRGDVMAMPKPATLATLPKLSEEQRNQSCACSREDWRRWCVAQPKGYLPRGVERMFMGLAGLLMADGSGRIYADYLAKAYRHKRQNHVQAWLRQAREHGLLRMVRSRPGLWDVQLTLPPGATPPGSWQGDPAGEGDPEAGPDCLPRPTLATSPAGTAPRIVDKPVPSGDNSVPSGDKSVPSVDNPPRHARHDRHSPGGTDPQIVDNSPGIVDNCETNVDNSATNVGNSVPNGDQLAPSTGPTPELGLQKSRVGTAKVPSGDRLPYMYSNLDSRRDSNPPLPPRDTPRPVPTLASRGAGEGGGISHSPKTQEAGPIGMALLVAEAVRARQGSPSPSRPREAFAGGSRPNDTWPPRRDDLRGPQAGLRGRGGQGTATTGQYPDGDGTSEAEVEAAFAIEVATGDRSGWRGTEAQWRQFRRARLRGDPVRVRELIDIVRRKHEAATRKFERLVRQDRDKLSHLRQVAREQREGMAPARRLWLAGEIRRVRARLRRRLAECQQASASVAA